MKTSATQENHTAALYIIGHYVLDLRKVGLMHASTTVEDHWLVNMKGFGI